MEEENSCAYTPEDELLRNSFYYYKKPGGKIDDPTLLLFGKNINLRGCGEIYIGKEEIYENINEVLELFMDLTSERNLTVFHNQQEYFGKEIYEPVIDKLEKTIKQCCTIIILEKIITYP